MDLTDAIRNRKSIRAFKPDPIPAGLLENILKDAIQSPSAENIQPWEFSVVNAKTARKIGQDFGRMIVNHAPINPDINVPKEWGGVYKSRAKDLGKELFNLLDIQRDDREKRRSYYLNMYNFFGAPNVIFIYIDKILYGYDWAIFDLGLVTQNIILLAVEAGLGTCILGAPVFYPDIVKKALGIPQAKKLVISIAIGYPDWDAEINWFKSKRMPFRALYHA